MKYMGSKNRIAKHILPIILKDRKPNQWYVEPFVGGANMIDKVDGNRIGADINHYVIALLEKLKQGWIPPDKISEKGFLEVKNNKDDYPDYLVGYIGTQLSFGSVWFSSFRKDNGGVRDYALEAKKCVLKQAEKLKGIIFYSKPYHELNIPTSSIIYCDPPYKGTDKYRGFPSLDHNKFWEWCRQMKKAGHTVFVSEFNAPEDFKCVWEMKINTTISEKKTGKNVTEKLFTL